MQVSWREATARRLLRHGLGSPLPDVVSAVSAMVGAHAQVMSAAAVAVGMRTRGTTAADLAEAIWRDRALVKTFGPRGTVHLLPASEVGEWLGALSALPTSTGQPEGVRLEAGQLDAVLAAVSEALAASPARDDGTGLTIDELDDAVVSRVGSWARELTVPAFGGWSPRWRQAIVPAAHAGILVFGANRGTRVTYLPAPSFERVQDADLALLRRYLRSYGPATPAAYARWLAVRIGKAQELFDRAELDRVELDRAGPRSRDAWVNAGDTAFGSESLPDLRLLPYFDPYVVGSWPRGRLFPGPAGDRALAGGQAGNYPVLLLAGAVAGIWHLRRRGRRATMTVEPFVTLSRRRLAALDGEALRIGAIVGSEVEVVLGEVPVGPHA